MANYNALKLWLSATPGGRMPVTFREIESLLGHSLPRSAYQHRPWWANTKVGHSHAKAWLDAGWLTSEVDMATGRLVFVRSQDWRSEAEAGDQPASGKTHRIEAAVGSGSSRTDRLQGFAIALDSLSPGAIRLIEERAIASGMGVAESAAAFLNEAAMQHRRDLVAEFARLSPVVGDDSADLIREDRDGR